MTSRAFLALALATAPLFAGCLHARAQTVVDSPPLEIPVPPPRVIETVEVTPPPPLELPEEPLREPVSPPIAAIPPRPAPRAEAPAQSDPPPKVEPSAEPRAVEEAPRPPVPTLQTTPAVAEGEVARGIRVTLDRAAADLKRVNFGALSGDGRTQFDTARRFLAQGEDALNKRNLVLARSLADKALVVAAQLAPR